LLDERKCPLVAGDLPIVYANSTEVQHTLPATCDALAGVSEIQKSGAGTRLWGAAAVLKGERRPGCVQVAVEMRKRRMRVVRRSDGGLKLRIHQPEPEAGPLVLTTIGDHFIQREAKPQPSRARIRHDRPSLHALNGADKVDRDR